MRALVVYESLFGNARTVAEAIAEGLARSVRADVMAAADASPEIGADVVLLVVGGPNHAFGMPRQSTRESAVQQYGADVAAPGRGLREWLQSVGDVRPGLPAAAFDTRISGHLLLVKMDHAAKTEEKLLSTLGAKIVAPAEHFFVADRTGPLMEGEQERARRWGQALADQVGVGHVRH